MADTAEDTQDTGTQDTGTQDTGTQDTGTQDTGTQDTGTQDTGTQDTGTQDTGTQDTGSEDPDLLGTQDTGTQDAGTQDTDPNAPRAEKTFEDGSWQDQHGNVHQPEPADPDRPEWLPEKFNSPEDMAEAYKQLEKKLSEKGPDQKVPDQYELQVPEGLGMSDVDEEDQKFFRENGFSNEQAQAFLDYVGEGLMPQIQKATTEAQTERLGRQWDMDPNSDAFKQRLGELKKWADDNLPESVVNDLRKSANGVSAMFQMMQGKMSFAGEEGPGQQGLTQAEIDSMVSDSRYGQDEAYTQYVEEQVRRANREK
jgi:hypothetical protein